MEEKEEQMVDEGVLDRRKKLAVQEKLSKKLRIYQVKKF